LAFGAPHDAHVFVGWRARVTKQVNLARPWLWIRYFLAIGAAAGALDIDAADTSTMQRLSPRRRTLNDVVSPPVCLMLR
jgi:hypothetical protein